MKLGRRNNEPAHASKQSGSPQLLRDRGIFAPWYMTFRLEEELARAQRYGRPLAVMLASPQLLDSQHLSPEQLDAAIAAAQSTGRNTDLVGFGPERQSFWIIMPETSAEDAEVAASRWRSELWMRGRSVGAPKWDVALVHSTAELDEPGVVEEALRQRLQRERGRPDLGHVA